ncbi:MAG TPA: DUF4185 domain-containing protein [Polyangiales bacterium]|nr:DUF4185 domain-containing protein [Polyangiales bacterium]
MACFVVALALFGYGGCSDSQDDNPDTARNVEGRDAGAKDRGAGNRAETGGSAVIDRAGSGGAGSGSAGKPGPKPVDAGADARPLDDAMTIAPEPDACPAAGCVPFAQCDDERPCSAPDTICLEGICAVDPEAPGSDRPPTTWSSRVGRVGSDDRTLWCTPAIDPATASEPARVTSDLQLVSLDGALEDGVTASEVAQRVRVQCFEHADLSGPSTTVTGSWSIDEQGDRSAARCPMARPHAAFARCQLAAASKPPFVYAGSACGDGASGLKGKPVLHGQLIGDHYELPGGTKPLFNDTGAQGGRVVGTDLGYQFLAQGRMYIGFGDTWENDLTAPGPGGFRGSVLANTRDFDPSDGNGIAIEGWDVAPDRPNFAREVIPCPHDQSGNTEFTAIGTSGFGLTEAGVGYRFLWFAAIKTWDPFFSNDSTLAWSRNGEAFERGDRATGVHPPRWPYESHFGPAAIWVDREQGYVYFIGVRTYAREQPLRLARVRATLAAVFDHMQYEYWTGSVWQKPDPADEYALARSADTAADLIPGTATQSTRPEISVAYNPFIGRFIMMVQNDPDPFTNEPRSFFQLWQAQKIEGPWTVVSTGDNLMLASTHYGAYLSEQSFAAGGRDVYFALSDWNLQPLVLGQPYVVGLWSMELERSVLPGCEP